MHPMRVDHTNQVGSRVAQHRRWPTHSPRRHRYRAGVVAASCRDLHRRARASGSRTVRAAAVSWLPRGRHRTELHSGSASERAWTTADKRPVKNCDLSRALDDVKNNLHRVHERSRATRRGCAVKIRPVTGGRLLPVEWQPGWQCDAWPSKPVIGEAVASGNCRLRSPIRRPTAVGLPAVRDRLCRGHIPCALRSVSTA